MITNLDYLARGTVKGIRGSAMFAFRTWYLSWALVATLLVSACTPAQPATPAAPVDLIVGITSDPTTLDVHQRFLPVDRLVNSTLHDPLVIEAQRGQLQPGLAESWEFASDNSSVTLRLRKNVKFHDGTPLNAEAVKFNYERQLDTSSEFNKLGTWRVAGGFAGNIAVPIQVVDENTVKINFKQKLSSDLNLSYMTESPHEMVSPTAVRANREKYGDKPTGTGPYRFVSWEKGQRLVLERNPDYWGQKPKYDRLIFVPLTDADARLSALRAGTIDINADVSGDQLEAVKSDGKFQVYDAQARHLWHVLLNQKTVPQLKDKRVRQALNYAVNKDAIVKDVLKDQGVVAKCFMSAAYGDWQNTAITGYPFDQAKAKQLLADAGFPNGTGFPTLTLRMNTGATLAGKQQAMAEVIQANLAAIGVKITLEPLEAAAWSQRVPTGDFQLSIFSLSISTPDPDNAVSGYHSSRVPPSFANFGYYQHSEYETLYPQSRSMTDRNQRLAAVKRMQKIACQEDPAAIFVEHAKVFVVANKSKVKSVQLFTAPTIRFNYIDRP
jgi:peptide/nickel transport system substrate-binding protein